MSTTTATYPHSTSTWTVSTAHAAMYLVPLGRLLFALIFLVSAPGHFKAETIQMAASAGLPAASFFVPAAGVLEFIGAAMILIGWHARIGAVLLIAFLVPVTLVMHAFWSAPEAMRQMQMAMFMKNLGLMGARRQGQGGTTVSP
jgi:putative oxidoreductase